MQEFPHEYAQHHYLNPNDFIKMSGLWCIRVGHNVAKSNYQVGPKRIECYSLHFVVEGQLLLQSENGEAILQPNDLCCFFPDESYSYRIYDQKETLKLIWIAFQGPQALTLLHSLGLTQTTPVLRARCSREVWTKLYAFLQFISDQPDEAEDIGFSTELQEQLYGIFAVLMKGGKTISDEKTSNVDDLPWLKRSLDFMQLHALEGISIKEVAEEAGVHRSYFSDIFKKRIGVSPNRYLYRLKMEKAAASISLKDRTITEVAYSVGYPSLYSFSRAFRNYYGYSPENMP
ncbi:helix-turn-helix transcriptional regulator [Paenibacillus sp. CGMCC 1.16610]|uniref:AraC family transcriptional regulator n=1 Tax=Paenibacillus anseongense TaxID=2682845 RepID=A0ABW9UIK3_9BACL|nr:MULTISPECIES: AraC family transcriptional regulator [Paenibacillus]MBA2941217.1 helix-turn-helix transcriptional regulator [Paenibacillus sp. CGMCC 1.16610]MVQ40037.1 AraC family transcriptional regulator [Paenibacillus anseongense]